MSNPFKSKPGSKKLNDPTSVCPLGKGEIDIEVYGYDPRDNSQRQPIQGARVTVTGPTTTDPALTPASGKWRYQPLNPGNYTVAATFPPDLDERYDVTNVPNIAKVIAAGQTETAIFLVPSTWVEFIIQDTGSRNLPLIPWVLERRPAGGATFARYDTGTTGADGKISRVGVRTGRHKLTIKLLSNPTWSAADAIIGESITLKTDVEGFDAGETGTFEIVDSLNPGPALDTIAAKVKADAAGKRLEAAWKPAEGPFATLKTSRIAFRAKAGGAVVYSAPVSLLKKDKLKFVDLKGTAVNRQVKLYFSAGTNRTLTTVKGEADVQIPWGETLYKIELPALAGARVKIEPGGQAGAVAV